MEITQQHLDFEAENTMEIGGIQFIVTAHFDDTREPLQPKLARLLQKDVENQVSHL